MSINIVSGNERSPINRMIQGSRPLPLAAQIQTPKQFMRLRAITTALIFCLSAAVSATRPAPPKSKIETFAGAGQAGYAGDGGQAAKAQLDNPFGVARGPDGALYICDTMNHVIRKVDRNGIITTVAGAGKKGYSGDGGPALDAALNEPYEIRFNKQGVMFFVERLNHVVRRVDAKTRIITTVAGSGQAGFSGDGGAATQATLNQPHSIQFDARGDLYICDILNHRIRKVDMKTGVITTFAGTGDKKPTPDGAKIAGTPLNGPRAIDFDRRGDMWLALREGNAVYRLDMKAGTIHHVAGTGEKGFTGNGGAAKLATLSGPKGLSVAPNGDVYLADTESHSIRMIDLRKQTIELIAGTGAKGDGADGDPLACQMARPHGVFVDRDGSIFIGDSEAHRVRVIRIGAASGSERSSIKRQTQ
jgi:streptogramin lyase